MDEADEVAPFVAMLHWGDRAVSLGRPDPTQDRLEANAMFIDRPQLDLRLGEGRRHLADERPQLFLNCSWAAGPHGHGADGEPAGE